MKLREARETWQRKENDDQSAASCNAVLALSFVERGQQVENPGRIVYSKDTGLFWRREDFPRRCLHRQVSHLPLEGVSLKDAPS